MKATTQKFKQIMASGESRNYVVKVDMTLADSLTNPTVLHLDESDMWNDSFKVETASSGTSSFDIGTAIIGQCKFALNNFDERFNQYDFFNATAVVYVGLKGDEINGAQQYVRFGFFTVDEPTFAGALIELVLLDNMWKFDRPLKDVNLSFPASAQNAVIAICSHCGVTLQTQQFHGYNFSIAEAPKDMDKMNCREFLQYVAMIGCNFCIINEFGDLEIKWYDTAHIPTGSDLDGGTFNTNTTPYSDGDTADGGNFIDYTSGVSVDGGSFNDNPNVDYFTRNFNLTLGTDVITITGVKFVIDETAYTIGTDGYRLELENPLVNASNVNSVLNLIWDVLENFSLRTFNLTCASDLAVEVGDCCAIKDYKGNYVYSWVTYNVFAFHNQQIQCNAIPPTRTLSTQYSKTVQAAVEQARKQTDEQISDYDLAVQRMNQLAANASGLYWIDVPQSDGTIIYYESDKPLSIDNNGNVVFTNHSHVWKRTGSGFFSSSNSGTSEATTTWTGGIDANNNATMNTIATIGLTADWIKTGTLEGVTLISKVQGGSKITIENGQIDFKYGDTDIGYLKAAYSGSQGSISRSITLNSSDYIYIDGDNADISTQHGLSLHGGSSLSLISGNGDIFLWTPYGHTTVDGDLYLWGNIYPTSSEHGIDGFLDAAISINVSIEDVYRNSDGAITDFSIRCNYAIESIDFDKGIITDYDRSSN